MTKPKPPKTVGFADILIGLFCGLTKTAAKPPKSSVPLEHRRTGRGLPKKRFKD